MAHIISYIPIISPLYPQLWLVYILPFLLQKILIPTFPTYDWMMGSFCRKPPDSIAKTIETMISCRFFRWISPLNMSNCIPPSLPTSLKVQPGRMPCFSLRCFQRCFRWMWCRGMRPSALVKRKAAGPNFWENSTVHLYSGWWFGTWLLFSISYMG